MRFKRTRSLIFAQSFPGKAGATTSAFIYQLLVNSVTAARRDKKDTRERTGDTKECDDPFFPKERSFGEVTRLRTDHALDSWLLQPEEDGKENNTARRPTHIDLIDEHLKPAMISTDAIATARGHMYRSSYVLTFLGGTVAVWIGLTGIFFKDAKHWFVLVELLLLFALTGFYYLAKARSWHERWLNARHITESLRVGRFLVWLGLGGRQTLEKDAPWSAWYTLSLIHI